VDERGGGGLTLTIYTSTWWIEVVMNEHWTGCICLSPFVCILVSLTDHGGREVGGGVKQEEREIEQLEYAI
jgi:hypothetical protein